ANTPCWASSQCAATPSASWNATASTRSSSCASSATATIARAKRCEAPDSPHPSCESPDRNQESHLNVIAGVGYPRRRSGCAGGAAGAVDGGDDLVVGCQRQPGVGGDRL